MSSEFDVQMQVLARAQETVRELRREVARLTNVVEAAREIVERDKRYSLWTHELTPDDRAAIKRLENALAEYEAAKGAGDMPAE